MKDNEKTIGVSFFKSQNKWRASIKIMEDGISKTKHLGYFNTKEDAIKKRKEAEIYYGNSIQTRTNKIFKEKKCEVCGENFAPVRPYQIHCNLLCYMAANTNEGHEPLIYDNQNLGSCIEWTGALNDRGYGAACWNGIRYRSHQLAWLIHYNKLDEKLFIRHLCNNPKCCNIKHLVLGTHQENMQDRIKSGKFRGENHPQSKLSDADREYIRNSTEDIDVLCAKFNVCRSTTYNEGRKVRDGINPVYVENSNLNMSGEGNPSATLTDEIVKEMFENKDNKKQAELAREYNTSPQIVSQIFNGKIWNNVTGLPKTRIKKHKEKFCIHCDKSLGTHAGKLLFCSSECAFWHNVIKCKLTTECWSWSGYTDDSGYAKFSYKNNYYRASIFSFDLHNPTLVDKRKSENLHVSHECHNKLCCNPNHLKLRTNEENGSLNKGRECMTGENAGGAKLSKDHAKIIIKLIKNQPNIPAKDAVCLLDRQNIKISIHQFYQIKNKKNWNCLWEEIENEM